MISASGFVCKKSLANLAISWSIAFNSSMPISYMTSNSLSFLFGEFSPIDPDPPNEPDQVMRLVDFFYFRLGNVESPPLLKV